MHPEREKTQFTLTEIIRFEKLWTSIAMSVLNIYRCQTSLGALGALLKGLILVVLFK